MVLCCCEGKFGVVNGPRIVGGRKAEDPAQRLAVAHLVNLGCNHREAVDLVRNLVPSFG